jgi:hypothetical protein
LWLDRPGFECWLLIHSSLGALVFLSARWEMTTDSSQGCPKAWRWCLQVTWHVVNA